MTVPFPRVSRRAAVIGLGGLLAAGLKGCGGGGGGGSGVAFGPGLQMAFFTRGAARAQAILSNRPGDEITLWTDEGNVLTQGLYAVQGRQVRVYFSGGALVRIVDEGNGSFVVITVVDADRTDYDWYDAAGAWQGGFAALRNADGGYSLAPIESGPALQGSQLSGTLSGPLTASFTLLPAAGARNVLGTPVPLVSGSTQLFTRGSTAVSFAPHRRLPAMLMGTAYAGDDEDGPPSWFRQRQVLLALLLMAGGMTLGVRLSPLADLAAVAVLVYATYFMYGSLLALGPTRVGNLFDRIMADGLQSLQFGSDPLANMRSNVAAYMASPTLALVQLVVLATMLARMRQLTHPALSDRLLRDPADLQPITSGPPAGTGATAMTGVMVDTGGVTWQLTATYNPRLQSLSWDTGTSGPRRVTGSGTGTSGSYSVSDGGSTQTGSYTVQQRALGACQTQQSSGGQGTFSNSYDLGKDEGSFELTYQMFSVPDRLDVRGATGQILYSTGGLVSGTQTVSIPFSGGRIVFVLISAPTSGTLWEYSIGCPA